MVLRVSGFLAFTSSSRGISEVDAASIRPAAAEGTTTLDKFMLTFGKIQGRR